MVKNIFIIYLWTYIYRKAWEVYKYVPFQSLIEYYFEIAVLDRYFLNPG